MRLLLVCFAICMFSCVSGWGRGDLEKYGPWHWLLYSKVKCNHDRNLDLDVSGVDVYFYDFARNETHMFPIADAAKRISSLENLDRTRKFIIFLGGYKSHINKNTEERFRQAFRNLPHIYMIILDHSAYTNDRAGAQKGYIRAVQHVHYIGKALAAMLVDLKKAGVSPIGVHCIGHSLGAQMLGHTGEIFTNVTGEKIGRITALDPAGPCFSNNLIQEQVRSGVAEYVEVYHCNAGGLGTSSVLGDIDFFANKKGQTQPDCGTPLIPGLFDSSKAAKCNHKTCVNLYTATVAHPDWFVARKCNKYGDYKDGKCDLKSSTIAGYWNPGDATGVYYFSTEGFDLDIKNNTV